jgi:hypothetical protein
MLPTLTWYLKVPEIFLPCKRFDAVRITALKEQKRAGQRLIDHQSYLKVPARREHE